MIHRQVHLPIPCYDFCFLQMTRFEAIQSSQRQPPCYSLSHPIGNSDGRCVQRPETYSTQVDDLHLLGIPHSRQIITIVYPQHSLSSKSSRPSRARCNFGHGVTTEARTKCTKNFLIKTVQRASGPEHLRASRTFYRLKLPLVKTPVVPLRTCIFGKEYSPGRASPLDMYLQHLAVLAAKPAGTARSRMRSRWLSKLMSDFTVPTSQRPCTTFDNHRIKKELQSVFPHGVRLW